MNPHSPVTFGVIGYGHIGKRHAEMIRRLPDAKLVAVCDIRPEVKDEVAILDQVQYFASAEEMISGTPHLDVVCIATPNGLHASQAILAIENGKHVVIEKPMALNKADCEKIIHLALQKERQVFCVMQNRFSPPSVWMRNLLEQQMLGEIFLVQVNCFWNRDDRYYSNSKWKGTLSMDGGTLFTQFSHFIDILFWLFGDISNISARFEDFTHHTSTEFEDTGIISFNLHNGALGTISYSTAVWDTNFESSLTVIGSKGTVKIGGQYMNEVEYCHIKDYTMPDLPPANPANDYGPYKGSAANHHFIFENVMDVLRRKASISTNALEGMKVVEIIERIYQLKAK